MDFSTSLKITAKGAEEIKSRTHKLGMKKRSVLLLLDKPQMVQYILGKSVFPQAEIMADIHELVADEFIAAGWCPEPTRPVVEKLLERRDQAEGLLAPAAAGGIA